MRLSPSPRRLMSALCASRSLLCVEDRMVSGNKMLPLGSTVGTSRSRSENPGSCRSRPMACNGFCHPPMKIATMPTSFIPGAKYVVICRHAAQSVFPSRPLRAQRSAMRCASNSADSADMQAVFAFEDSKVVTNVLKGEKMSEVNFMRKKEMEVLFIDEETGGKSKMTLEAVVKLADSKNLDPVMVAPDADVPVMKLMDYRKERHRMLKKAKEASKHGNALPLKEVRLGLNVGKSDLDRLMKQAAGFLEKGHRVKLFMRLKGKDFYTSQDKASEILVQMATSLSEVGTVENPAELVGRSTNIFLSPLKKGKGKEKGGKKDKKEGDEKKGKKDKASKEDVEEEQ